MTAMFNRVLTGWLRRLPAFISAILLLTAAYGCAPAATAVLPSATAPVAATAAPLVKTPSPTPTLTPTHTTTPTAVPTMTATATLPPTSTAVPPLAVTADGFSAWCAPQQYQGVKVTGPDAPEYANLLALTGERLQVKIPAAFCVLAFRFNQPLPEGANLVMFSANSPFVNLPLKPAEGDPELGWAVVGHDYVINPPFWEITYPTAVLAADGTELWAEPVTFAKPLPNNCPFGGLPDPVTLYCRQTDPKELEPHPDVTFPAYYTLVPPED